MFQNFMCTSRKKRIAEGQQISFDGQGATSNVDVMFMCAMFIYLSARENGRDLASPVRTDVARPAACEPVTSAFGGKRPSFADIRRQSPLHIRQVDRARPGEIAAHLPAKAAKPAWLQLEQRERRSSNALLQEASSAAGLPLAAGSKIAS